MLAPLYHCSKCGDTWNVISVEQIDTDNDEVWDEIVCGHCYGYVTPVIRNGSQVHHVLTPEEMEDEMYLGDDEFDEDEVESFD